MEPKVLSKLDDREAVVASRSNVLVHPGDRHLEHARSVVHREQGIIAAVNVQHCGLEFLKRHTTSPELGRYEER